MTIDPHLFTLAACACGVGVLMAWSGVHKNALEWKRRRRFCPSCGREQQACRC